MSKSATLTIQKWGNSLAVRIPVAMARSARFAVGQPVEISSQDGGLLLTPVGDPDLSLAQMLAAFDPKLHAGEAMVSKPIGREIVS
jgi:antitoxin MazE